jgi:hypothetical protein
VQDDVEDWRLEGSKMASTYSQSYITIAASSSPNANGGLSRDSTSYHRTKRIQFTSESTGATIPHDFHVRCVPESTPALPLLRRAWIYQERMLSPRVVHFGFEGLEWECRKFRVQERIFNKPEVFVPTTTILFPPQALPNAPEPHQKELDERWTR